jgi:hypothetical protein
METWVDPQTGALCQRRTLGSCTYGRLFLRPSIQGRSDLYWSGSNLTGGFDYNLKMTIAACWKATAKATGAKPMEPRPMPVTNRPGVWWLCRLPSARYLIETRSGGGAELAEILPARPRVIRPSQPPPAGPSEETPRIVLRRPVA